MRSQSFSTHTSEPAAARGDVHSAFRVERYHNVDRVIAAACRDGVIAGAVDVQPVAGRQPIVGVQPLGFEEVTLIGGRLLLEQGGPHHRRGLGLPRPQPY
jgi:hypothetical protein